jgi:hypothetical protein
VYILIFTLLPAEETKVFRCSIYIISS